MFLADLPQAKTKVDDGATLIIRHCHYPWDVGPFDGTYPAALMGPDPLTFTPSPSAALIPLPSHIQQPFVPWSTGLTSHAHHLAAPLASPGTRLDHLCAIALSRASLQGGYTAISISHRSTWLKIRLDFSQRASAASTSRERAQF